MAPSRIDVCIFFLCRLYHMIHSTLWTWRGHSLKKSARAVLTSPAYVNIIESVLRYWRGNQSNYNDNNFTLLVIRGRSYLFHQHTSHVRSFASLLNANWRNQFPKSCNAFHPFVVKAPLPGQSSRKTDS